LVLLPCVPGPRLGADGHPLKDELRVDGAAAAWVRALLAGLEVIGAGALRRANGRFSSTAGRRLAAVPCSGVPSLKCWRKKFGTPQRIATVRVRLRSHGEGLASAEAALTAAATAPSRRVAWSSRPARKRAKRIAV